MSRLGKIDQFSSGNGIRTSDPWDKGANRGLESFGERWQDTAHGYLYPLPLGPIFLHRVGLTPSENLDVLLFKQMPFGLGEPSFSIDLCEVKYLRGQIEFDGEEWTQIKDQYKERNGKREWRQKDSGRYFHKQVNAQRKALYQVVASSGNPAVPINPFLIFTHPKAHLNVHYDLTEKFMIGYGTGQAYVWDGNNEPKAKRAFPEDPLNYEAIEKRMALIDEILERNITNSQARSLSIQDAEEDFYLDRVQSAFASRLSAIVDNFGEFEAAYRQVYGEW